MTLTINELNKPKKKNSPPNKILLPNNYVSWGLVQILVGIIFIFTKGEREEGEGCTAKKKKFFFLVSSNPGMQGRGKGSLHMYVGRIPGELVLDSLPCLCLHESNVSPRGFFLFLFLFFFFFCAVTCMQIKHVIATTGRRTEKHTWGHFSPKQSVCFLIIPKDSSFWIFFFLFFLFFLNF